MRIRDVRLTAADISWNVVLYLFAAAMVFPFIWLLSTSLKSPDEVLSWPPRILPHALTIENYRAVFSTIDVGRYFLNTFVFASVSTISIILTSALAGYVFAKFRFRFKEGFFMVMISTMMVPFQCYMIPLYLMMVKIRAVDTYMGLQLPYLVQGMGTFYMRQNFETLPDEYIEAARLEGASEMRIFWQVALPCLRSALGGLAIFIFASTWGNLVWPLIITSSEKNFVMELGLTMFQQRYTVNYGEYTAAAIVAIVPVLAFFTVFRRQIMEGITLSGIK